MACSMCICMDWINIWLANTVREAVLQEPRVYRYPLAVPVLYRCKARVVYYILGYT